MHSCEPPPPAAAGAELLKQVGRMIIRSASPTQDRPSTSQQEQPRARASVVEERLNRFVQTLWDEHQPLCVEVLLGPNCVSCACAGVADDALLLERWTLTVGTKKISDRGGAAGAAAGGAPWLCAALRSRLHFSQLGAWAATNKKKQPRDTCNVKKFESNRVDHELIDPNIGSKLNIIYSIHSPKETYKASEFTKPPIDHTFPITDIGNNTQLKIVLESLPRLDTIPAVICKCQPKRNEDLSSKMLDLNLGPPDSCERSQKLYDKVVDDRMHTPCSENGKHKCSCDDESDGKDKKEVKELAKYKRRLRKESKLRKLRDSNSESSEEHKSHSSIPILQASRFDRLRAIGCYRNQTYLTLPASRVEAKPNFTPEIQIPEYKKTNTIATQTDDVFCDCGVKFATSDSKMVRSEANYDLASMTEKPKCDKNSFNSYCDNSYVKHVRKCPDDDVERNIIKRPKLRKFLPIVDKLERIVTDRIINNNNNNNNNNDIDELFLKNDDSVFAKPVTRCEREKHPSISEDYVIYEKCSYANYDRVDAESPKDGAVNQNGFVFPDSSKTTTNGTTNNKANEFQHNTQVNGKTGDENEKMNGESNGRIEGKSIMFHDKTGLPLTSSPAPLKRGKHRFDFDESIKGVSGVKSALFPSPPTSPHPLRSNKQKKHYKRSGLLGSFEECLLKGRFPLSQLVQGFSCSVAAAGSFCPKQLRLPVHVAFVDADTATYRGHIDLPEAYHVPPSGTIQVSLFNPHGTLVKMFVVLYDLTSMPYGTKTFLRQRTLYLPAGCSEPPVDSFNKYLRYLIHLRFMTSKSGKLYLHSDIKILVSKRADMDTASAHSAIFKPTNHSAAKPANHDADVKNQTANHKPCRVFGGYSDGKDVELGYENGNNVAYELRSFTYGPENPKYSPR